MSLYFICLNFSFIFSCQIDQTLWQFESSNLGDKLIALALHSNADVTHHSQSLLFKLSEFSFFRPKLGNSGIIAHFLSQLKDDSTTKRERMLLVNALCFYCQEVVNRAKMRDEGVLQLFAEMLSNEEFSNFHFRLVSAVYSFSYSAPSMTILLQNNIVDALLTIMDKVSNPNKESLVDHLLGTPADDDEADDTELRVTCGDSGDDEEVGVVNVRPPATYSMHSPSYQSMADPPDPTQEPGPSNIFDAQRWRREQSESGYSSMGNASPASSDDSVTSPVHISCDSPIQSQHPYSPAPRSRGSSPISHASASPSRDCSPISSALSPAHSCSSLSSFTSAVSPTKPHDESFSRPMSPLEWVEFEPPNWTSSGESESDDVTTQKHKRRLRGKTRHSKAKKHKGPSVENGIKVSKQTTKATCPKIEELCVLIIEQLAFDQQNRQYLIKQEVIQRLLVFALKTPAMFKRILCVLAILPPVTGEFSDAPSNLAVLLHLSCLEMVASQKVNNLDRNTYKKLLQCSNCLKVYLMYNNAAVLRAVLFNLPIQAELEKQVVKLR